MYEYIDLYMWDIYDVGVRVCARAYVNVCYINTYLVLLYAVTVGIVLLISFDIVNTFSKNILLFIFIVHKVI